MSMKAKVKKLLKRFCIKEYHPFPVAHVASDLLSGKTALITGGSGGIGFAIAKKFAEAGACVILVGQNEEKLIRFCDEIGSEKAKYIVQNICVTQELDSVIERSTQLFPDSQIDILVNSAGLHGPSDFLKITEENYDSVMNINLKAMFFMSQKVGQYMIDHKIQGHILNVGSASGAKPAWTPYEISKWGVRGFTLGLARELIPYGIVVNSIAPGPVATSMLNMDESSNFSCPTNPSGRVSSPDEIANLALFMVSDLGNGIVGDTFFITGGSGTICIDK